MSRILGVDFDNTLACYDRAFHQVGVAVGLIGEGPVLTKQQVKARLHDDSRFEDWTRLQGLVYGPEIGRATPFEGALETLSELQRQGWKVYIVSHKTRYPVIGDRHDLHAAAGGWLAAQGFTAMDGIYFEQTLEGKIARIASLGCQAFVDDLAEVLADPQFPSIRKLLFQPSGPPSGLRSWSQVPLWLEE